jgi:hypothetical protein
MEALAMVYQHANQDEPEALLAQCATLRGFVEQGLGLNDVVSNLIGKKMAEALKTFERDKFMPMAKVVQSKVNSACVQVAMVLMSHCAQYGIVAVVARGGGWLSWFWVFVFSVFPGPPPFFEHILGAVRLMQCKIDVVQVAASRSQGLTTKLDEMLK